MEPTAAEIDNVVDVGFLIICAIFTMTFQGGFALLESGSVSPLHTVHVALKNIADFAVGSCVFAVCGYAFAWGEGNSFGGATGFMSTTLTSPMDYAHWLFQLSFSATSATIVSGGTAGRMRFGVYVVLAAYIVAFVYPFAARWTWHPGGFLRSIGYVDFAGGGTVHVLGGTAALVCTVYLKPRIGVFHEDGRRTRVGCNPVLVLLGCFLLWVGWFAFNAGSAGGLSDGKSLIAARAATNTAGASGTGCLTAMLYSYLTASKRGGFDMFTTITGLLSALVGVTPSAAYVPMWVAFIIGFLSAGIGVVVSHAVERMMIDDPVDAFAVHGASGIVGLLAAGIFADTTYGQPAGFTPIAQGLVHGGGFRLLGVQALGVTVIFVWSLLMTTVFLVIASRLVSIRTSRSDELTGTNSGLELMMACPDTVRAEVVSQLGEIDDDSAGPIKLPRHLRNRVKVSPHTSSHSPHGCAHDRHPRDEVATAGAGTAAVAMDAKAAAGSHA